MNTPDEHWSLVSTAIVSAGQVSYARQPYSATDEEKEWKAERDVLLRRRADARTALCRQAAQERDEGQEREPTLYDERILE